MPTKLTKGESMLLLWGRVMRCPDSHFHKRRRRKPCEHAVERCFQWLAYSTEIDLLAAQIICSAILGNRRVRLKFPNSPVTEIFRK